MLKLFKNIFIIDNLLLVLIQRVLGELAQLGCTSSIRGLWFLSLSLRMGFDPGERSFINSDFNPTETSKNMKTTL